MEQGIECREDRAYIRMYYRGIEIADARVDDRLVVVATRTYSHGFVHTRGFATMDGARRYLGAWWKKWQDSVRMDVAWRLSARDPMEAPLERSSYVPVEVTKRPARRGRSPRLF